MEKENLAYSKFKEVLALTDFSTMKIYYVDTHDFFGESTLFFKEVRLSSHLQEYGISEKWEEAIVLHEFGHIRKWLKHLVLSLLIIIFETAALLSFLAIFLYIIGLIASLVYSSDNLFLFGILFSTTLLLCFISSSIFGSLRLYIEIDADDYARTILRKKGKADLMDKIYYARMTAQRKLTLIEKINVFMSVGGPIYFIISRREIYRRLKNREWIWTPLPLTSS